MGYWEIRLLISKLYFITGWLVWCGIMLAVLIWGILWIISPLVKKLGDFIEDEYKHRWNDHNL